MKKFMGIVFILALFFFFTVKESFASESSTKVNFYLQSDASAIRTFPLRPGIAIRSFSVSGKQLLKNSSSLVRITVFDASGREYLVYESYPLIADTGADEFLNACEETCAFSSSINPITLRLETVNASIDIGSLDVSEFAQVSAPQYSLREKISKMNGQIQKRGLRWTAGETSLAKLTYSEKKQTLGFGQGDILNSQGIEHYRDGIFTYAAAFQTAAATPSTKWVASFDWRTRHGKNLMTPVRTQSHCNSCWAFSVIASVEAVTNLYYNAPINPDLSEQQAVCNNPGSCKQGGNENWTYSELLNQGITSESCYPYNAGDSCKGACANWASQAWKISSYRGESNRSDENIKKLLIEKGPMSFGIASMFHTMLLVGYETAPDGKTTWIFKNSKGPDWGDKGYGKLVIPVSDRDALYYTEKPYPASNPNSIQIACEDKDGDNYCNWGLSQTKPSTCLSNCKAEKDCDDSNPSFGPYDSKYACVSISPVPSISLEKKGDANKDGTVDGVDYVVWLNNYGKEVVTGAGPASGDFDLNGFVDGIDYVVWLNNYGK